MFLPGYSTVQNPKITGDQGGHDGGRRGNMLIKPQLQEVVYRSSFTIFVQMELAGSHPESVGQSLKAVLLRLGM